MSDKKSVAQQIGDLCLDYREAIRQEDTESMRAILAQLRAVTESLQTDAELGITALNIASAIMSGQPAENTPSFGRGQNG